MAKIEAPAGMAKAGSALWGSITETYELRADELNTLEHICRMTDMIHAIDKEWAAEGRPLRTKGSMGQLISHPSVSELRTHRMAVNALWRQLKLPDEDSSDQGGELSAKNRTAANARWSKRGA